MNLKRHPVTSDLPQKSSLHGLERSVEQFTGLKAQELRDHTITSLRRQMELKHNAHLSFISRFPFIGRGNVLRDRVVSRQSVEQQLEAALR